MGPESPPTTVVSHKKSGFRAPSPKPHQAPDCLEPMPPAEGRNPSQPPIPWARKCASSKPGAGQSSTRSATHPPGRGVRPTWTAGYHLTGAGSATKTVWMVLGTAGKGASNLRHTTGAQSGGNATGCVRATHSVCAQVRPVFRGRTRWARLFLGTSVRH